MVPLNTCFAVVALFKKTEPLSDFEIMDNFEMMK